VMQFSHLVNLPKCSQHPNVCLAKCGAPNVRLWRVRHGSKQALNLKRHGSRPMLQGHKVGKNYGSCKFNKGTVTEVKKIGGAINVSKEKE
jgi:hypothetical protein